MRYIDIGLNLFCDAFKDPDRILSDAREQEVACILTGSDAADNEKVYRYTLSHDVWGTAGIHPHNASRAGEEDFLKIQEYQTSPRIVAVGECGLDYDRMFSPKEQQIDCLMKHIAIAEELQKPMFLHEREASVDFIPIFREHLPRLKRAVVHCFTGDRALLERYLEMGFYIGITGWICDDRRAQELRDAVKILPLDRVMLETDAPYLTPRNVKGLHRTNVPQNVRYVAAALAEYMGVGEELLVKSAFENTVRFFELDPAEICNNE